MPDFDVGELLDRVEAALRDRYLAVMARLRARNDLDEVERMVRHRRYGEAIRGLDEAAEELSSEFREAFLLVAGALAVAIRDASPAGFAFDLTHWRVQAIFRAIEGDLVTLFRRDHRAALLSGLQWNDAELAARELLEAVGLGSDQTDYVRRVRQSLGQRVTPRENGRREAAGRPRRQDIDAFARSRMVGNLLAQLRAAQAARVGLWLGQLAIQSAADVVLRMAAEFGAIDQATVRRTWRTMLDDKVRDSHGPMEGQVRALGVPFTSAAGVPLLYPGDASAPAKETRGCRCGLTVSF